MSHLNDEFFYQAFSEEERRIVKDIYPTDVEYNKICKVTLLSQEEVQQYFPENMRLCSPARIYQGTEMLNSITVQIGARESWWLRGYERSPKSVDITGKIVGQFGKIIRPAICIDPELYTHSDALVEEMTIGANVNIGDIVEFGRYEQDNDTSNGKEKIEWLVLDKTDDAVFVISKNIIETEIYDNLHLRDSDGNNIVNGKMFNTVLESREEQDNVLLTILTYYMGRAELSGKMFLIDYETFERYRSIIESVEFQMTPYVLAKTSDKTLRFALRGQKYVQEYKDEYNNLSMSTGDIRYTYNYDAGIRPAMWIKINSD